MSNRSNNNNSQRALKSNLKENSSLEIIQIPDANFGSQLLSIKAKEKPFWQENLTKQSIKNLLLGDT
jgi:hypothetical protein